MNQSHVSNIKSLSGNKVRVTSIRSPLTARIIFSRTVAYAAELQAFIEAIEKGRI